jgi:WD40 repeat protein
MHVIYRFRHAEVEKRLRNLSGDGNSPVRQDPATPPPDTAYPLLLQVPPTDDFSLPVRSLAVHPDGQVAVAYGSDTIRLLDATSAKSYRPPLTGRKVETIVFSQDGRMIACASRESKKLVLYDFPSRNVLRQFRARSPIRGVSFAADSRSVAAVDKNGTVHVWCVKTGELQRRLTTGFRKTPLKTPAIGPQGQFAAAVSGNRLLLWEEPNLRPRRDLAYMKARITATAVSSDAQLLAWGAEDGSIGLWHLVENRWVPLLHGADASVGALDFTPDSAAVVSVHCDGTTRYWDVATGKELHQFAPNVPPLAHVALCTHRSGLAVGAGKDRRLFICSLADALDSKVHAPDNLAANADFRARSSGQPCWWPGRAGGLLTWADESGRFRRVPLRVGRTGCRTTPT